MLIIASIWSFCSCSDEEPLTKEIPEGFKMTAEVKELGEKLLVYVTEAEYAEGPFLLITNKNTVYLDRDGKTIGRADLHVGDTVEIFYGGQVMMSYPPQIVAAKIVLK